MLVNDGVYNQERILSSESIKIMTSKYTNGYPDPDEPGVFPDLAGYYVGFTFSVLENPEVDGTDKLQVLDHTDGVDIINAFLD